MTNPPQHSDVQIVLATKSDALRREVTEAFALLPGFSVVAAAVTVEAIAPLLRGRAKATILIVDATSGDASDLDVIRGLKEKDPDQDAAIVALFNRGSDLGLVRAIRAGADDVLLLPINAEEARDVFTRILAASKAKFSGTAPSGKLISFVHVAGGAGATTLAVNAAFALAKSSQNDDACLFDLDIQFGNAANLLDISMASRLEDLLAEPHRLDRVMLEHLMVRHATGLRVLTAPRRPVPLEALRPETVSAMIGLAKRHYTNTVADLPMAVTSWTDTVLRASDVVFLVVELSVSTAYRTRKFLDLLQAENFPDRHVKVVANRHRGALSRGNDVAAGQFAKAIGRPVDFLIPNDYHLISLSHGQGKAAVRLKPGSDFAKHLQAMLDTSLAAERPAGKPRGFFSRSRD